MDVQDHIGTGGAPPPTPRLETQARFWRAICLLIVVAITVAAFAAYRQPDLLLNLLGLRYCG